MRAPTAIDIRNLSLTFQTGDGPVYALADANLTIAKGEFVSFIGPSGCGKTTLLRVIADLEQPTSGSITVNGLAPRDARLPGTPEARQRAGCWAAGLTWTGS